jgi:hypothetical protein
MTREFHAHSRCLHFFYVILITLTHVKLFRTWCYINVYINIYFLWMLQLERISFHYVYKFARRSRFSLSLASVSILFGTEDETISLIFIKIHTSEVAKNSQFFIIIFWWLESVFFAHTHLSLSNYGFVAKKFKFHRMRHNCFFSISVRF